jgi:hypothetical protein
MRERADAHANDECKMANDEWVRLPRIWAELGIPADYAGPRGLSPQPEATQLIRIGVTAEGRELFLTPPAAQAWEQVQQAAAIDGIALQVVSAFRSIERQAEIIRAKLARAKRSRPFSPSMPHRATVNTTRAARSISTHPAARH